MTPQPVKVPRYLYVRAWCKLVGSNQEYTERQVSLAIDGRAVRDATYFNMVEERWVPKSDILSSSTLADLERIADDILRAFARGQQF